MKCGFLFNVQFSRKDHWKYKGTEKYFPFKGSNYISRNVYQTEQTDFKTVLNIFEELKEIVDKEIKEIRKIIYRQNENIKKEMVIIFFNSGAEKAITELRNSPKEFSNRLEQT